MDKPEVYNWLRQEIELTIAFDTNVLFRDKSLIKLCDNVNLLKLYGNKKIRLVVPAPAHLEKLHDLKQQRKEDYNLDFVLKSLGDLGIEITAFEPRHAEIVAELIGKQFPTTQDWRNFKRKRCLNCLGLQEKINESIVSGSGKNCGATVDWLIAGYADAENCLLITEDKGEEFKNIRKTNFESLIVAVEQLLKETEVKTVVKP